MLTSEQRITVLGTELEVTQVIPQNIIGARWEPKPTGLWYACGDEWLSWMASEMPHWLESKVKYAYELELDFTNMLIIDTAKKLEKFQKQFGFRGNEYAKDWATVADDYTGIEICPYFWDYRHANGYLWYNTWDVASGCIWDLPSVIVSYTELNAEDLKAQVGQAEQAD